MEDQDQVAESVQEHLSPSRSEPAAQNITETTSPTNSACSRPESIANNSDENAHTSPVSSPCTQEPAVPLTSLPSIQLLTTSLGMSMIAQLSSTESESDSSDDSVALDLVVSDSEKDVPVTVEVCPKVKGEIDYRDLPFDGECKISFPTDGKLLPIGEVSHYTEKLIVIKSFPNTPAVNEGTILWREDKTSIAPIFETFGPVKTPFYSILVDSKEHSSRLGLETGDTVYVVPGDLDLTVYVFTSKLLEEKGCDASWKNDLEMPPEYQQFSDDEQESLVKKKKNKKPGQKPSYTVASSSQFSKPPKLEVPRAQNRPLPLTRPAAPPISVPQTGTYSQASLLPHFMGPSQPPLICVPPINHIIPQPYPPPYVHPYGHPYPFPPPHPYHQFPPPPH